MAAELAVRQRQGRRRGRPDRSGRGRRAPARRAGRGLGRARVAERYIGEQGAPRAATPPSPCGGMAMALGCRQGRIRDSIRTPQSTLSTQARPVIERRRWVLAYVRGTYVVRTPSGGMAHAYPVGTAGQRRGPYARRVCTERVGPWRAPAFQRGLYATEHRRPRGESARPVAAVVRRGEGRLVGIAACSARLTDSPAGPELPVGSQRANHAGVPLQPEAAGRPSVRGKACAPGAEADRDAQRGSSGSAVRLRHAAGFWERLGQGRTVPRSRRHRISKCGGASQRRGHHLRSM